MCKDNWNPFSFTFSDNLSLLLSIYTDAFFNFSKQKLICMRKLNMQYSQQQSQQQINKQLSMIVWGGFSLLGKKELCIFGGTYAAFKMFFRDAILGVWVFFCFFFLFLSHVVRLLLLRLSLVSTWCSPKMSMQFSTTHAL